MQRGLQVAVIIEADLRERRVAKRLREFGHLAFDGAVVEGKGEIDGHPDEERVQDDEGVVVNGGCRVASTLLQAIHIILLGESIFLVKLFR